MHLFIKVNSYQKAIIESDGYRINYVSTTFSNEMIKNTLVNLSRMTLDDQNSRTGL